MVVSSRVGNRVSSGKVSIPLSGSVSPIPRRATDCSEPTEGKTESGGTAPVDGGAAGVSPAVPWGQAQGCGPWGLGTCTHLAFPPGTAVFS